MRSTQGNLTLTHQSLFAQPDHPSVISQQPDYSTLPNKAMLHAAGGQKELLPNPAHLSPGKKFRAA